MLDQDIEFLGEAIALVGKPLKALGKLTVDRSDGGTGVVRPATLFYRPSSVVVGIVRHQG